MKDRLISAAIYLASAFAMYRFYDAVSGSSDASFTIAERLGVVGLFAFLCAFLLSLWKRTPAVVVGAVGCALCWPDLVRVMSKVPFRHVVDVMGYAMWNDTLLASAMLVLATAFSLHRVIKMSS